MQAAVLSDIHANLPALEAVLTDIEEQGGADTYLFCGDVVGYYCWPNEAIRIAKERDFLAVRGNHDDVIARGELAGYPAQEWSRDELTETSLAFLQELPYSRRETLNGADVYIVHGSPRAPVEEYVYPEQVREAFFRQQGMRTVPDILLLGHTHVPFTKYVGDALVLNPGSVGQPRDGDPKASYALLDAENVSAEINRVAYDIDQVADRVREEGLPEQIADRLYAGQ